MKENKESVVNVLVGRKKIEWIAYNHKLTNHAKMQMMRRGFNEGDLRSAILNSPLSWKFSEGYVGIALNLFEYLVVTNDESPKSSIVTYVNLEDEEYSVIDKMLISYQDAIREKAKKVE
jgi:hypothetical protein